MNLLASMATALGIAVLASLGLGWYSHHLSVELTQQGDALTAAREANGTNATTIIALRASVQAWSDKYATDVGKQQASVAAIAVERDNAQKDLAAERAKRKVIYAGDPHAQAWADTAVPAAVVDELRAAESGRTN